MAAASHPSSLVSHDEFNECLVGKAWSRTRTRRRSRRRREKGSGEASTRVKQMESGETFPEGGEIRRHRRSPRQQRVKKETKPKSLKLRQVDSVQ